MISSAGEKGEIGLLESNIWKTKEAHRQMTASAEARKR